MEWQNFLNLCICQERQLQHVEDYRRVSGAAGAGGSTEETGPWHWGRQAPQDKGRRLWPGLRGKVLSHPRSPQGAPQGLGGGSHE